MRIDLILAAARDAGAAIRAVREEGFSVQHKGSAGPVTEADGRADRLLKERLLALVDAAWLSEETADDKARLTAKRVWIVDPLDGTKEFVEGLPEYTVAIALVDHAEPVLGVVHNPATRETYWAEKGRGAFGAVLSDDEIPPGQRIVVKESHVMLASRTELSGGEFAPFEFPWQVTPVGSIEYKLALIAAGKAAATVSRGPKHEWDVAAGALLVTEAGGVATDLDGAPLRFNQPFPKTRGILAGAPEAYRRARSVIARVGASGRMGELDRR